MTLPLELRPNGRQYWAKVPRIAVPVVATVVVGGMYASRKDPFILITVGIIVAALVAVWAFFRRAFIRIDHDGLGHRKLLVTKHLPTADLGQVVFVPQLLFMDPRLNALLSIMDSRGKRRLTLTAPFWTLEQMNELVSAISAPIDILGPSTIKDVNRAHPRALSMYLGHPYRMTALIIGGILVVLLAGAAVAAAFN